MASKYTIPVTFTYQQQPIPSEQVNQNYAYIIAALNAIVDDFRSPASPVDPEVGMVWQDSSGAYPVFRIYEDALFKWFGIFVGTTAEKPLNPRKGAVFFDTTLSKAEYFNGTSWVKYSIAALSEDPAPVLGGNLVVGSYTVGDATAADLTKLHGITATVDELNYVDGVTSALQTQLDAKTEKATLTTKGDLYIRDASVITRLPVGADGETLIADSTDAKGVKWSKSIEDQIVDGVTTKAPSQNAVYDALALKTDKATLTTKGDLYIRDATGVTRLPVGSDGEIPIADSAQTSGILWTPGRKQLTSAVTVTVGTGGDFATINAALNYLVKTYYPIYLSTGTVPQATIRLLTGFVMAEQVLVEGMDLGWITITGDDAETTIQRSALTKSFNVGYPAFCVIRGTLLTIGQLFSMDTSGVADNRHGIAAVINGRVTILPGYGVKNVASRGITAEHGSIITAYSAIATGAERGIYSLIGSIINADAADTSGATLYGISLYSGSIVNARGATGTLSQTANTITSNGIIFQ